MVNTPTTQGSIGLTTGLDPAMTLGCGGYGGNITSDNISPMHLLNIKRLAYEVTPANAGATTTAAGGEVSKNMSQKTPGGELSAETLRGRIDTFLASRGYRPDGGRRAPRPPRSLLPSAPAASALPAAALPGVAVPNRLLRRSQLRAPGGTFVARRCRAGRKAGKKIVLGDRTIANAAFPPGSGRMKAPAFFLPGRLN